MNFIHSIKSKLMQPTAKDVRGAAWALARLQEVYDLNTNELINGNIRNHLAIKGLKGRLK